MIIMITPTEVLSLTSSLRTSLRKLLTQQEVAMATIQELKAQMLANFASTTENLDNITGDITRLHARIEELATQVAPITQAEMEELANMATALKARTVDIAAATPEP